MSRLFITAAQLSSGKTTVAIGLAATLAERGLDVRTFELGPDDLDALWLAQASGRPCHPLDFATQGKREMLATLETRARGGDLALIVGDKGFHDGADPAGRDSSAALAKLTRSPAILVVDALSLGRGVAALVQGYARFDRRAPIAGVILNRVGSEREVAAMRQALERYTDIPLLGALGRSEALGPRENRLGRAPSTFVAAAAAAVRGVVDLDALLAIAARAPVLAVTPQRSAPARAATTPIAPPPRPVGRAYIVGAGPGDPELLTLRALRLMQDSDVVLYDRLAGSAVMQRVPEHVERIYVGKRPNDHELSQAEIIALMIELVRAGKRVLRLKGGDPFMFGRGGEEIVALAEAGLPFEVCPGVTAAAGAAAYAGIPLTHRDHAQACVFVTGHGRDGHVDLEWQALIQPHQTVAIYMGLRNLELLTQEFIARGVAPDMPAAIVENATRPNQKVVVATLETLAARTRTAELRGPAIVIVGTVVRLRDKLLGGDGASEVREASDA